jgi:hypothetical protein
MYPQSGGVAIIGLKHGRNAAAMAARLRLAASFFQKLMQCGLRNVAARSGVK